MTLKRTSPHSPASRIGDLSPLVLVNLDANQGRAADRWEKMLPGLKAVLPSRTEYLCYRPPFDIQSILQSRLCETDCNCVISAGGDGTAHHILNSLTTLPDLTLEDIYLGGIGLGSSNDFTKPVNDTWGSIPVRISPARSVLADIGKVTFENRDGADSTRYFVVNASVGVTAEANLLFNSTAGLIGIFKKWSVNLAIIYAALKTIITYDNIPITLATNSDTTGALNSERCNLSNLAVLKNPHVSGSFRYDQEISDNDGWLGLNYCVDMNRLELFAVLRDLAGGTFSGKPKRHSSKVTEVQILTDKLVALEMDGEVIEAANIRFNLSTRKINLLG